MSDDDIVEKPLKKSPWTRAAMPGNPDPNALPVVSLKEQFDLHMDNNYKNIPTDKRKQIWNKVGMEMLSKSTDQLLDIIKLYAY